MNDAPPPEPPRRSYAPALAVGLAGLAAVIAVVTAIVMLGRGGDGGGAPRGAGLVLVESKTLARDLAAEVYGQAFDGRAAGVVARAPGALGLAAGDVITAIAGRKIDTEADARDALIASVLGPRVALVFEVVRDGRPVLVRVAIVGDLSAALEAAHAGGGPTHPPPPPIRGITQLDFQTFEVERALFDRIVADPVGSLGSVRAVPTDQAGVPDGYELQAIPLRSLPAQLGFANGDTISAVNGRPFRTPAEAAGTWAGRSLRDRPSPPRTGAHPRHHRQVARRRRSRPVTAATSGTRNTIIGHR